MRDSIGRARLYTVAAENAPAVIDVVDLRVTLAGRDAVHVRVFRGLNVNAIRGASGRAQKAAYAFFQPAFVAVQHVDSAIARLKMHRLIRVVLRNGFPEHRPEGHAEALYQRPKCLTYFANYGWHILPV